MDWTQLISDNFAVIGALGGACIGGLVGIFSPVLVSLLQHRWSAEDRKRQRKWELDDQRREARREEISQFKKIVDDVSVNFLLMMVGLADTKATSTDKELLSQMFAGVDLSLDNELNELYGAWTDAVFHALGEGMGKPDSTAAVRNAQIEIHRRLNELDDQTYDTD
jgi:hypothetical protein